MLKSLSKQLATLQYSQPRLSSFPGLVKRHGRLLQEVLLDMGLKRGASAALGYIR